MRRITLLSFVLFLVSVGASEASHPCQFPAPDQANALSVEVPTHEECPDPDSFVNPEPSSLALMGVGLLGLWKRRNKK